MCAVCAETAVCAVCCPLLQVGSMMLENLVDIDWGDVREAVPAFLTVAIMPLTYSIAYGVSYLAADIKPRVLVFSVQGLGLRKGQTQHRSVSMSHYAFVPQCWLKLFSGIQSRILT